MNGENNKKAKNKIYISDKQKIIPCTAALRALVKKAVNSSLAYEGFARPCEVSVTFVDDSQIQKMNLEHRGADKPTDVLSFPIFDDDFDDGELAVLGDIVISLERALAQSTEYGHSFEREVAFLCVHSVLHLVGYDHEEGKAEESEMFARQEAILALMGLTRNNNG